MECSGSMSNVGVVSRIKSLTTLHFCLVLSIFKNTMKKHLIFNKIKFD